MLKLCFYVPESHLELVKQAIFDAGAGKIETYDQCCWQVKGQGQFRPLKGSHAFIGSVGLVEHIDEFRVEMLLDEHCKEAVIAALKQAHPYEVPAYDLCRVSQA